MCLLTSRGACHDDFAPRTRAIPVGGRRGQPREKSSRHGRAGLSVAREKKLEGADAPTLSEPRRGGAHDGARDHVDDDTRARRLSRARRAAARANPRAHLRRRPRRASLPTRRRVVLRRVSPVDSDEDVDVTAEPSAADAWRIRPATPDDIPAGGAAAAVSGVDRSPSQIAEEQARGALLVAVPAAEDATATATDTSIAGPPPRVVADEVQILEVAVHPTLFAASARASSAPRSTSPRRGRHLEVRAFNDARCDYTSRVDLPAGARAALRRRRRRGVDTRPCRW